MMKHQENSGQAERRGFKGTFEVPAWMPVWMLASTIGLGLAISSAHAQGQQSAPSIPGLVITTTPPTPVAPREPVSPLRTGTVMPPEAAKPKPKPKAAPTRQASTDSGESAGSGRASIRRQGIIVLVNDEPITGYEVDQRATLMAMSANIGERAQANFKRIVQDPSINQQLRSILEETIRSNQGKTREQILAIFEERKKAFVVGIQRRAVESARSSVLPGLREKALDEIIDERLKVQEGKRLSIVVSQDEVDRTFKEMAERNKMTEAQFVEQLKTQGLQPDTMKARTRAAMVWRDVIRRKFGHQISVTDREVDRFVQQAPDDGSAKVELHLHKITLAVPGKIDQAALARRLGEAERLRRKFGGCKSTQELTKGLADSKFENLASQAPTTVSEPTRSLLLNARDGEMVPPTLASAGVELYAVCGRKTVKVNDETRLKAQQELTMREFDVQSRKHLRDLRTEALIERR
jgi:peptidyl-prolyl cis-trans isomerase SurA